MEVGNFETACRAQTLPVKWCTCSPISKSSLWTLRYCTEELFIYNQINYRLFILTCQTFMEVLSATLFGDWSKFRLRFTKAGNRKRKKITIGCELITWSLKHLRQDSLRAGERFGRVRLSPARVCRGPQSLIRRPTGLKSLRKLLCYE